VNNAHITGPQSVWTTRLLVPAATCLTVHQAASAATCRTILGAITMLQPLAASGRGIKQNQHAIAYAHYCVHSIFQSIDNKFVTSLSYDAMQQPSEPKAKLCEAVRKLQRMAL
jgi:hypothetical protein